MPVVHSVAASRSLGFLGARSTIAAIETSLPIWANGRFLDALRTAGISQKLRVIQTPLWSLTKHFRRPGALRRHRIFRHQWHLGFARPEIEGNPRRFTSNMQAADVAAERFFSHRHPPRTSGLVAIA